MSSQQENTPLEPENANSTETDVTDAELEALLADLGMLGEDIPELNELDAQNIEDRLRGSIARDTLANRSLTFAGAGFVQVVLKLLSPLFTRNKQQRKALVSRRKRREKS